jgi:outer membrane protein OmpA-like peptidoglycan-associated protein
MKKLFLMLAAATFAANVSAQNTVITSNKFGDNWYFGVNAGVSTQVKESGEGAGDGFFKSLAPTVGLRLGKNLSTVFGLAIDADMHFKSNEKWNAGPKTFVECMNADLLGTFNLSNLFGGYQGEPRAFEIIALGGFGWTHEFCHLPKANAINSRVALDFAFNLGAAKAVQFYIEPSLTYSLHSWYDGSDMGGNFNYNLNNSYFAIKAGLNYKFGNSNGTHNFANAQLRDQNEIDQLNAKINELRAESNAKDGKIAAGNRTIADLQSQLTACQNKPAPTAKVVVKQNSQLQPIVIFGQGKSTIDAAQYASVEMVAKYMRNHKDAKILIKGYASPEGDEVKNKALADGRAESVKNALIKRYKIAADRITAEGMGATSDLSEENDFNRVAMFFDTTVK